MVGKYRIICQLEVVSEKKDNFNTTAAAAEEADINDGIMRNVYAGVSHKNDINKYNEACTLQPSGCWLSLMGLIGGRTHSNNLTINFITFGCWV